MNKLFIATALILIATGCAHKTMRGSVAMKTSDRDAHVCFNKGEVALGDTVRLYNNRCTKVSGGGKGEGGGDRSCEKVAVGNGVVTKIINDHYSQVTFDPGVEFEEGSFVEKL